jgi:hypothetical protein
MMTFNVLILLLILVYVSVVILWRELGRPIFLEGVFELTQFLLCLYKVSLETN